MMKKSEIRSGGPRLMRNLICKESGIDADRVAIKLDAVCIRREPSSEATVEASKSTKIAQDWQFLICISVSGQQESWCSERDTWELALMHIVSIIKNTKSSENLRLL